mmetsp:Transcript_42722/g.71065  ORF Transcript_42722/g.71065 Transcript_42722/m.71065 type:complete len:239 (+) Transcript_42722:81-797(+)
MATVMFLSESPPPLKKEDGTSSVTPIATPKTEATTTDALSEPIGALERLTFKDPSAARFDWSKEYHYYDRLYSDATLSQQFALLTFETPVIAPLGSILIGSRLDADIHVNACRLAFSGNLLEAVDPSNEHQALSSLKVFKWKTREGIVDRTVDDYTVIGRDLFKKETDIQLFVGLKLERSLGEGVSIGVIESSFGKSGKFKVHFPQGGQTALAKVPGSQKLVLQFRRYIFDAKKKMVQ